MVNGRLRCAPGRDIGPGLRRLRLATTAIGPIRSGLRTQARDVSNFMKIRHAFAANTRKIANTAFKPVC
jgi:hypothetical protein